MSNAPNEDSRTESVPPLDFDPKSKPRELNRHYVAASEHDLNAMLKEVGVENYSELFAHVPKDILFESPPDLPEELSYEALQLRLGAIAARQEGRLPCSHQDGEADDEEVKSRGVLCDGARARGW